jgi:hypothetical protein
MEVNSVPEKCLTGALDDFGGALAIEWNIYRETFGDDVLRFASHEES